MKKNIIVQDYLFQQKESSDNMMNYFLGAYFLLGLGLAFFYDTWLVATVVGSLSLIAYYSVKLLMPRSDLYQYVLSGVMGIFMAQFIYQMHGMFEMHFVAFIGSAILITYQNWRLQIPLTLIVVIHHALFGYLQYIGYEEVYFTQLDYMDLQTFIIHALLAAIIFYICGLWAYQMKKNTESHIEHAYDKASLLEAEAQKKVLMKANRDLVKTNRELDQFVYSVSHDLRAPLSSIMGVVDISRDETTDPQMLMHLGFLEASVKKLDVFIHDILDYSRNTRTQVKQEEINFKSLLQDSMNNLKYMGEPGRRVDVRMNIQEDGIFKGDPSRLHVIFNNLISNAIRYSRPEEPQPFVEVDIKSSTKSANITIRDNGIGIPKDKQHKIFDMFYRVSEKSVGTGIGLYIVKETVEKLDGRIEVESEPGIGTAFRISLPNAS